MDGKATLKLRKPLKDNVQHLYHEKYDVLYCHYGFDKGITKEGDVRTAAQIGNIQVALPMLPTNELLTWVLDKSKKYNGEITIHDNHEESLDKIYFEEARCVGFRLHYQPSDMGSCVMVLLTINAQRVTVNDVEYKNSI